MTTWREILDSEIDPDSPLTTDLMFALRDNIKAFAEGDPSAPTVTPGLFNIGGGGYDGPCGDAFNFLDGLSQPKPGFYDVTSLTWTAITKALPMITIIRVAGNLSMATGATVNVGLRSATRDVEKLFGAIVGADGSLAAGAGGSLGAGGAYVVGNVARPLLATPETANRFWAMKRPILGGNSGGNYGGYGGGSLILLVDGTVSIGATIDASGWSDWFSSYGAGGGGSIIIIALGAVTYLSGATLRARGGFTGPGAAVHDGGGGYIGIVAPSFSGSRTLDVSGANAGLTEEITMTAGQIKNLLWGR